MATLPSTSSSSSSSPAGGGAHILIIPYPAQGHMLALLDLSSQLSVRGLKITVLVTPKNLSLLTPLLSAHPSIQTLVLPFPSHPQIQIPAGVENIKDLGNRGNPVMVAALSGLQGPITEWFSTHPDPPRAIISDFFLGWTHHLAARLGGIPRFGFYSSCAFLVCVLSCLFAEVGKYTGKEVVQFTDLPHSPEFKYAHLPSVFRLCVEPNPVNDVVKDGMLSNLCSSGCIFNSFWELEGDYLNHIMTKLLMTGNSRSQSVFAVGPISLISLSSSSSSSSSSGTLKRANPRDTNSGKKELFRFLDDSPDGSVLYVSFGSQKWLSEAQSNSLATALDQSGARFIWVARSAPGTEPVPDRFEEKTSGRGFVVKGWASQEEILAHRAVGGFLSHCGWNSVMEALVAGVMILAWPMEADQFLNARLLVDEIGVAVLVCEGAEAVPESGDVATLIKESMSMGGGEVAENRRAREWKDKARQAVEEGGSSAKGLEDLVKVLNQIGLQHNNY